MIVDLERFDAPVVEADICIIGAGAVGCLLAARLADLGRYVVLLEAGGEKVVDGTASTIQCEQESPAYGGARQGRGFGLGGTSALWGGMLVPLGPWDLAAAPPPERALWAHIVEVVRKHGETVRETIGLAAAPASHFERIPDDFLGAVRERAAGEGLGALGSEMLPFPLRNFARLLDGVSRKERIRTFLNATVHGWQPQGDGPEALVEGVQASSPSGRSLTIRAPEFVVTAGTIESARILLEIDRATKGSVIRGRADVGRYLSDHLSAPIATFTGTSASRAVKLFAQRFDGRVMNAVRFADADVLSSGRRHFVHVAFMSENPGFLLAKKVLAAVQARRLPMVSPLEAASGFGGLAALAFHRYVRKRLFVSSDTPVHLQLDVEQRPRRESGVRLLDERDRFGRSKVHVSWGISEEDLADMIAVQRNVIEKWNRPSSGLPPVEPVPLGDLGAKLHDTFHPVGTCRMGQDPGAVLDLDLRVRGLRNVRVVSTAAFPSAGCANPTFACLCFGEAVAQDLSRPA